MERTIFHSPVRLFVGLGMPQDIGTPFQAYTFLRDMPRDRHHQLHAAACAACLAASNRQASTSAARDAFVAYAAKAGILAPEMDDTVALTGASEPLSRLPS